MKANDQIIKTLQSEKEKLELKITSLKDKRKQDRKYTDQIKEEKTKYMEDLLSTKDALRDLERMKVGHES